MSVDGSKCRPYSEEYFREGLNSICVVDEERSYNDDNLVTSSIDALDETKSSVDVSTHKTGVKWKTPTATGARTKRRMKGAAVGREARIRRSWWPMWE